jgi:acetyl esterase/lipase
MGAPGDNAATHEQYAGELGAVVVSVDYRLAPETPHPGPVEDCYAALSWLYEHAGELGVDRARIAVSGESAGGGLAAALALVTRDRAEIPLVFQHLVFPALDDRTASEAEPSPYVGEFAWTRDANCFAWRALLGFAPGAGEVSPYAAPARADDLSRLPPAFIACGSLDLFAEENMTYARRLVRAGVPTELHIYPGAPHGFMMVADAPVTRAFTAASMAALARALA